MRKNLLFAGGACNAVFTLFHIWLGWRIYHHSGLDPGRLVLMEMLNVGGILTIFLFTCISFFCMDDLVKTKLGKMILFFVFLFYGSRALEELFFAVRFNIVILLVCVFVGGLYLTVFFLAEKDFSTSRTAGIHS